jgi:hypothetical protein
LYKEVSFLQLSSLLPIKINHGIKIIYTNERPTRQSGQQLITATAKNRDNWGYDF